jgi:hypothetical protein
MTRVIRESKKRRTPLLAMALFGVVLGVLIGGGGFGAAAPGTGASVVDYAQCANGSPGTAGSNTCPKGWINGILQSSNSQYHEYQVTAQRLVLDLPKGGPTGSRTITLKYLWNKGVHHAYDALATWDDTISGLDAAGVCAGVPGACPATSGNFNSGNGDSQTAMTNSTCTGTNAPSGQLFTMYGGTLDSATQAVNDSSTCSTSSDEYETVTIT